MTDPNPTAARQAEPLANLIKCLEEMDGKHICSSGGANTFIDEGIFVLDDHKEALAALAPAPVAGGASVPSYVEDMRERAAKAAQFYEALSDREVAIKNDIAARIRALPIPVIQTLASPPSEGWRAPEPSAELIDRHLDVIMKAAGSKLAHYEAYTKDKMRSAMRSAMKAALLASASHGEGT